MKRIALAAMLLAVAGIGFAAEIEVGTKAPAFALTNAVDGKAVRCTPGDGKLSVVVCAALDSLLAGQPVQTAATKAFGCSIKFKS